MAATNESEECAGAAIFAAKHETSSQMSRIAERLGMKVAKLNMRAKVCASLTEMIEVHCGEQEIGETCEVCDADCLAPAGYGFGGAAVEGTDFIDTICSECGCYVCDACSKIVKKKRICNNCLEESR